MILYRVTLDLKNIYLSWFKNSFVVKILIVQNISEPIFSDKTHRQLGNLKKRSRLFNNYNFTDAIGAL